MVDVEEARVRLERAMETKGPDFVYSKDGKASCLYVPIPPGYVEYGPDEAEWSVPLPPPTDDPRRTTGCLVGVAIADLLTQNLKDSTATISSFAARLGIDQTAASYFRKAQHYQDKGSTWGEAVAAAEEWYHDPDRRLDDSYIIAS